MKVLHVGANRCADGVAHSVAACLRANRACEFACAKPMKETPVHASVVDDTHRAAIAIRQNRLGPAGRFCDLAKALCNRIERVVPTNALETSFTLCTDPPHRIEHAIRVVDAFEIASDLGAEKALSWWMIWIT